jgi:hypothetical protein
MRYAAILALGAVVLSVSGCGATRSRAIDYSVQQVKAAFGAHGLPLRQARFGPASNIVKLLHPGIEVDVDVGTGNVSWSSVSTEPERGASKHNVIVTWSPRYARSVRAALRQLA